MERRKFINISSASIVLLSTGAFALNSNVNQKLILETESLGNIWTHSTIIKVGQLYRDQYPNENYSKSLMGNIPEHLINSEELPKFFKKKIIDEHKNNETVLVDGWLISKTEGQKCALVSIKLS